MSGGRFKSYLKDLSNYFGDSNSLEKKLYDLGEYAINKFFAYGLQNTKCNCNDLKNYAASHDSNLFNLMNAKINEANTLCNSKC